MPRKPQRIIIRRARASDKKIVLNFCRHTWGDWGDFMDKVWDEWVKDRKGFFAVAALGRRPVGTAKLSVINKREVWFQGLRVDPSFRGTGISHLLTGFLAKEALRRRAQTVRYATGADNRPSLHIGKSWGLRLVGKYSMLKAASDGRRRSVFERVSDPAKALAALERGGAQSARISSADTARALSELAQFMKSARFTRAMAGLASEGWIFFEMDRDFLEASFKNQEVFVGAAHPSGVPLGILLAASQRKRGTLLVKLVAESSSDALGPLFSGSRKLAHELGLTRVRMIVPARRAIIACAKEAGFREEDEGFYNVVMEARLGNKKMRARLKRLIGKYVRRGAPRGSGGRRAAAG